MEGEYLSLDTAKKIVEKDKEIERLNKDLETSIEICNNRQKEIVRLNNIINELEKDINKRIERYDVDETINGIVIGTLKYVLDKLQELKGSNGAIPPEVIGTNGEDGELFDYGDR